MGSGRPQRIFGIALLVFAVVGFASYSANSGKYVDDIDGTGRVLMLPADEEHVLPDIWPVLQAAVNSGVAGYESMPAALRKFYSREEWNAEMVWKRSHVQEARWAIMKYWLLGFFALSGLAWTVLAQPPARTLRPRRSSDEGEGRDAEADTAEGEPTGAEPEGRDS